LRQGKESEEEIEGIKMVCSLAENCDGSGRISKETAMADLCLAAELQGGGGALASVRRRGWPAGVRLVEDVLPAASGGFGWSSRRRTGWRPDFRRRINERRPARPSCKWRRAVTFLPWETEEDRRRTSGSTSRDCGAVGYALRCCEPVDG
jgi:hypothetical protein